MSKRREVSSKYRMEVTTDEECNKCMGTGIAIFQEFAQTWKTLKIELSVCSCVRILPRLVHDPHARIVDEVTK